MKDAEENKTKDHGKAIKILIYNIFLDPSLVVQARVEERVNLVDTFWKEYNKFTLRTKRLCSPAMWVIEENPGTLAHEWHKTYSVVPKKVL